jgi:hypothetical protein
MDQVRDMVNLAGANHPASGNGAVGLLFHAARPGRAVPEPGRSAKAPRMICQRP